ncbi:MAG: hypothetical protein ABR992_16335 [Solirubrobacteraceae bacterium]|jgi:hypothetical protein
MGRSSVHSVVLLAAVLLAVSSPAALAQVSSSDASATASYLHAQYAVVRGEVKSFPVAVAAIEALAKKVQMECPGVLANAPKPASGTPPSGTTAEVSEEEIDAVFGVAEATEYARRHRFAGIVARLRWSNRALTRLVHSQAAAEAEKASIPAPSLCADMRSWVSSGYQAVSASTQHYLKLESALSAKTEGTQDTITRKLASYESPNDKRIAKKLAGLENSAAPVLLKEFFAALGKVSEALVTPVPTTGS